MSVKKKIILFGPPESGKTSLVDVFFKKANPLKLLENTLEPTRGVNSNVFSLFSSTLAIFDLAGQENSNWLSDINEPFEHANIIICMFDVRSSIEFIITFLIKVLKKRNSIDSLQNCEIFAFLHKIDYVHSNYVNRKIESINTFFNAQYKIGEKVQIFGTSLKKKYLYDTFLIIFKILKIAFETIDFPINDLNLKDLKTQLEICSYLKNFKSYNIKQLKSKFNLSEKDLIYHLKKLETLGFVEYSSNKKLIKLTTRSRFLENILNPILINKRDPNKSREIELLYTLIEIEEITGNQY